MMQTGINPFHPHCQLGANIIQPGPQTHDGLLLTAQQPDQGKETLNTINSMIKNLGQWGSPLLLENELELNWHKDMIWWGPGGIGSTYTIKRYAQQHSAPFRNAFCERSETNHLCRLAEGNFGGFFGWPNFSVKLKNDYLGVSPSDKVGEFRVIDIYRRKDNKLVENWVFIDLVHWMKQMGHDILAPSL